MQQSTPRYTMDRVSHSSRESVRAAKPVSKSTHSGLDGSGVWPVHVEGKEGEWRVDRLWKVCDGGPHLARPHARSDVIVAPRRQQ